MSRGLAVKNGKEKRKSNRKSRVRRQNNNGGGFIRRLLVSNDDNKEASRFAKLIASFMVIFVFMAYVETLIRKAIPQRKEMLEDTFVGETFTDIMPNQRIVNGVTVPEGKYSYIGFIHGRGFCGASLIAPDTVLTAAHCVVRSGQEACNIPDAFAVFGTRNKDYPEPSTEKINVKECIVHPQYSALPTAIVNDFAILKLERAASVKPVTLDDGTFPIEEGKSLTVMGWGRLSEKNFETSPQLMELELQYLGNELCQNTWSELFESNLCAWPGKKDYKSPLHGDSGGPLIVKGIGRGQDVQVGTVSFGDPRIAKRPGSPAVFGRVSSAAEWIKENTNGVAFASVKASNGGVGVVRVLLLILLNGVLIVFGMAFQFDNYADFQVWKDDTTKKILELVGDIQNRVTGRPEAPPQYDDAQADLYN